ncbi:hypothetical protein CHU98_g887 [Xylaria longipes]|nr:hypothetical protein CHU98_g887 [Xylaria longipes]
MYATPPEQAQKLGSLRARMPQDGAWAVELACTVAIPSGTWGAEWQQSDRAHRAQPEANLKPLIAFEPNPNLDTVHHAGAAEEATRRVNPTAFDMNRRRPFYIGHVEKNNAAPLSFMKPRELPAPTKPQTAWQRPALRALDFAAVLAIGWRLGH